MSVTLRFSDISELDSSIQKLADAAGSTVSEVLPAQMRLFAADLAYNTRPIGNEKGDDESGKKKIATRVGAVYKPVGKAVEWLSKINEGIANSFIRYVNKKQFTKAADILNRNTSSQYQYEVGMFDGGKLHREQARVKRATKCLIVINYDKVGKYLEKSQKLVGFAKGGFATAARQLGGVRGIPGFATRQNAPGSGIVSGDGKTLTVTMTNDVRYIEDALDEQGESRAINNRKRAIDLRINHMMRAKMKTKHLK